MIFTQNGLRYQVLIGTEGGIYISRWDDDLSRRHGTPYWHIISGPAN